jgi:AcrR family transcriptional regulator
MLLAAAEAAREQGAAGVTVADIVAGSGVSRRTFYEVFADRDECMVATLEEAIARATAAALPAWQAHAAWREQVRAGLLALLTFLDEEPLLGAFLVFDSLGAGEAVLRRRQEALATLVATIDQGRETARSPAGLSEVTAEGVVGAVLTIIQGRLPAHTGLTGTAARVGRERDGLRQTGGGRDDVARSGGGRHGVARSGGGRDDVARSGGGRHGVARSGGGRHGVARTGSGQDGAVELLGELMAIVVLPYLGPAAAVRELRRARPERIAPVSAATQQLRANPLGNLGIRLTYRTAMVLQAIATDPGASNRAVALAAGVADPGQISKLLTRLGRVGLIENLARCPERGEANAWRLTARGAELERVIRESAPAREEGRSRRASA